MRTLTRALAMGLALVWAAGCGGGDGGQDSGAPTGLPSGAAARVGHDTIPESAVRAQMDSDYAILGGSAGSFGPPGYRSCMKAKTSAGRRPGETLGDLRRQCRYEYEIKRAQALDTLVRARWLAREASRRGIDTDRAVAHALQREDRIAARLAAAADTALPRQSRAQRAANVARIRTNAQSERLMATVPLTEQEIADYGNANGDVFLESETRTARILQTTARNRARRARAQLERGTAWATVQHRYGVGTWNGTQSVKQALAPVDGFGRALFSAKRGKLVGPINTLNGWFLFQLTSVRPPAHRGLTRQAHRTVAMTLRSKRLDQLLHDHYDAQTTCAPKYRLAEAPQCLPPPH